LGDYVRKYKDMDCFMEDSVEKIENHKIESLAKKFLVEIVFLVKIEILIDFMISLGRKSVR
jgi:hypothetical protein